MINRIRLASAVFTFKAVGESGRGFRGPDLSSRSHYDLAQTISSPLHQMPLLRLHNACVVFASQSFKMRQIRNKHSYISSCSGRRGFFKPVLQASPPNVREGIRPSTRACSSPCSGSGSVAMRPEVRYRSDGRPEHRCNLDEVDVRAF